MVARNYWQMDGKHCKNCAGKLRSLCKYNPSNMSYPPGELMIPGRLSRRPRLRERNLCFLWYANNFWTRATAASGGASCGGSALASTTRVRASSFRGAPVLAQRVFWLAS